MKAMALRFWRSVTNLNASRRTCCPCASSSSSSQPCADKRRACPTRKRCAPAARCDEQAHDRHTDHARQSPRHFDRARHASAPRKRHAIADVGQQRRNEDGRADARQDEADRGQPEAVGKPGDEQTEAQNHQSQHGAAAVPHPIGQRAERGRDQAHAVAQRDQAAHLLDGDAQPGREIRQKRIHHAHGDIVHRARAHRNADEALDRNWL